MSEQAHTVGRYLAERLKQLGVGHVFGVPGDYVLTFMDQIIDSGIALIGTCNELNAGYAADAYGRINGLGALCVTYGVGGFSALNAVAGAYAEQVPVVAISGTPELAHRRPSMLLHHSVGDLRAQLSIYEHVTVASVLLTDPDQAPAQIDAVLAACLIHKRPVMIEIPVDLVQRPCAAPGAFQPVLPASDPAALDEALDEITGLLRAAERPAILAGVELHRFGLLEDFEKLVARTGIPVATTLLGKTVISERDACAVGVYEGAMSRPEVRRVVESADALLCLGAWMSEMDLGIYTAHLDERRMVNANSGRVRIRYHSYEPVTLRDLLQGLTGRIEANSLRRSQFVPAATALKQDVLTTNADRALTVRHLFARINRLLTDDTIVIADAGDALFSSADLVMHREADFIGQAFYLSIGYSVPAALGVQLAAPGRKVISIVGDGAFQMTAQELSTIIRHRLKLTLFLLNNDGYSTERLIHEGPYNDIHGWQYHRLPDVFGGGLGLCVRTEGELEAALERAEGFEDGPVLIEVMLERSDSSDQLKRLCDEIARKSSPPLRNAE
ncbi:MAG: alpha-keto acid decarboxylase family protein [Defluviicoccus sp.]|nr:MAG: alpha-keto acid decarboxylase family protein [Defluviicoccus sp.]